MEDEWKDLLAAVASLASASGGTAGAAVAPAGAHVVSVGVRGGRGERMPWTARRRSRLL